MQRFLTTLAILAVTIAPLSARTVRTIFVQPPPGSPETAFLFTGKKSLEVTLPQRNLSPEVALPNGDLTLAILRVALTEGAEIPARAQIVKIPKSWKHCLMVFVPAPKRKGFPAKVILINSSNTEFPKGNTMVYNLSKTLFMGKFGGKSIVVRPRKSKVIKPPINQQGSYPVEIDCVFPRTKKRSPICRTNWMHYPNARQILFVTPSPGQKVPRVWGVLDRRDEKEK